MAEKKRNPRNLTEDEVRRLTFLEPDDITKELMMDYFANFEDSDSKFIPQDRFVLRADVINRFAKENIQKEDVHTTIGRYIVNLFLLFSNPNFLKRIGYINETMDKGKIGDLGDTLASYLLNKEITIEEFYDYVNRLEWLGFANASFINPSLNYDAIKPIPEVLKKRDSLIKENQEGIDNGDINVSASIEKELINLSKEKLNGNPAKDLYDSGSKIDFDNQYKNTNIMGGPVKDNNTGKYRMVTKSYMEGLEEEDISAVGDSLVTGVYSRAVGTQTGGYEGKKAMAAFQTLTLDKKGTDCGSKKYLKMFLTKKNKDFFMYRYIKKGNSLIVLTPENISNYFDTYIELRSPLFCKSKKFCNCCAGDLYYKLGIENIGMTANKPSSIALNSSLKLFHDQTVKVTTFDWKKYFS